MKNEAEIVHDLALPGPVRDTYFSGVVLEKTPTGDRPVAGAAVRRLRAGLQQLNPSIADHEGRFRMLRAPGEQSLYGVSPDRSLAGLMPLPAEADNVRFVIARAPRISGRVIDSNGTPQPARSLIFRIDSSPNVARSGHQVFGTGTDDQGLFKVSAAPVGSYVEVSVHYPSKAQLGHTAHRRQIRGFRHGLDRDPGLDRSRGETRKVDRHFVSCPCGHFPWLSIRKEQSH